MDKTLLAIALPFVLCACASHDSAPEVDSGTDAAADAMIDAAGVRWDPRLPDSLELGSRRGLRVARGIVHAHSINSHDACDGNPRPGGQPNAPCLADLRHGLCATRVDFVMLTEHIDSFADRPFAELLLAQSGDELVPASGPAEANWIACGDGGRTLLLLGAELRATMPLGLRRHIDGEDLRARYSSADPALDAELRAAGAMLMVAHTESKTLDQLRAHDLDGIEVYNLHANLDPKIREQHLNLEPFGYLTDIAPFSSREPGAPEPDLVFLAFYAENRNALDKWNALLAQRRTAGVIGSDAHQNVMPIPYRDGERMDSYRRVFRWLSNHVRVSELTRDAIHAALQQGRSYMAFEALGSPRGFDFFAQAAGEAHEMGDEVALAAAPRLVVEPPELVDRPAAGPAPALRLELIHIDDAGTPRQVASGPGRLEHEAAAPGAYRVEVYIRPEHLRPFLGPDPGRYLNERLWIYSNPIYVR